MKESAENYLETILVLGKRLGKVRSIDVVKETGFSKPSISVAMKKLKNSGYIEIDIDGYIFLTELGQKAANQVLDRHTVLVALFNAMGVSPLVADEDACKVEHIISEETFQKIKEYTDTLKNKC